MRSLHRSNASFAAFFLLSLVAASVDRAGACTMFLLTDGHRALFFNNEDFTNPTTRIWFVPAGDDHYGCVYTGFDDGVGQGGMNTEGLAFDWYAGGRVPYVPDPHLARATGSSSERMLETCATVEDAIRFYQTYAEPGFAESTIFIADKTGASVIIGARNGRLYFDRSAESRALGYGRATFGELYRPQTSALMAHGTEILRRCFQQGRGGTKYSSILNLRTRSLEIYRFSASTKSTRFELSEELKKGPHYYDIPSLPAQIAGPVRPLLLNMRRMCLYSLPPLPDQEPVVTSRVRRLLTDVTGGQMQAEHYTKKLWTKLDPIQDDVQSELSELGKISSLTLVHRQRTPALTEYSYLVIFDRARVLMRFSFDDRFLVHDFKSLRGEATP